ncbi:hypothetical protein GEMRC1_010897 [Eukaryota sp. GEM-RC1]
MSHHEPLVTSNNPFFLQYCDEEVNHTFDLCCSLVRTPPKNYRIVKQAVQALVYISSGKPDLTPAVLAQLLFVLRNPKLHRSNPRRWAVRSLGTLAAHDPSIVHQMLDLLVLLVRRENEQSQYVRKAAFCALSRIGRKYPHLQSNILPIFFDTYRDRKCKLSIVWAVLIGLGRMAQSSPVLRSQMAPEWLSIAQDHTRHFRLRWACLKALGHACCSVGSVQNDPELDQRLFDICQAELDPLPTQDLNPDPFTESECYLIQYPACQALGLLLRSDPDKWWSRISPIFAVILQNRRYAAMVKSVVILTFGKLSFFSVPGNPFFQAILDILLSFSKNQYILVAEPAVFALTNFSICHPSHNNLYYRVRLILIEFLFPNQTPQSPFCPNIASVPHNILEYFLSSWGRHVARTYLPNLEDCSKVTATTNSFPLPSLPPLPSPYITAAIAVAAAKGTLPAITSTPSSEVSTGRFFYTEEAQGHLTKVDDRGDFVDEESLIHKPRSSSPTTTPAPKPEVKPEPVTKELDEEVQKNCLLSLNIFYLSLKNPLPPQNLNLLLKQRT